MTPNRLIRSAWLVPLICGILLATSGAPSAAAAADTPRHGWADGDSYILMLAGERGRVGSPGTELEFAL